MCRGRPTARCAARDRADPLRAGLSPSQLAPQQAARLAVMLPAPKRFEKNPASPYLLGHAATVAARMNAVALP